MNETEVIKATSEMNQLLRAAGSLDADVALPAGKQLAKALEMPLRQGLMNGDILGDIFETTDIETSSSAEYPLDLLAPGTEKEHFAYVIPNQGRIPQRHVEGDYVMVPTYRVGNSIDWLLKYSEDARWDIVSRALEVMEAGFVKKNNDDGVHVLLNAGVDRNIVVFDSDASPGQFTKRLVSLMKVIMRRNGGGNSTSLNRSRLTDIYLSPEGVEDMRNWGIDQIDEITRREIFLGDDDVINRVFGVNIHAWDELGEGQEYQNYFTSDLAGTLGSGDLELVVGLDLSRRRGLVNPVKKRVEIFQDQYLHREQRQGYYGWGEWGWGSLDARQIIIGSY